MLIKVLPYYILGYMRITIQGFYIERCINLCRENNIFFWGMKIKNGTMLTANVGLESFLKIRKYAKKLGCKIKIDKKKGLPFFFNKYKKRKIFAILLILVLVIMFILTRYIWNIEIVSNGNNVDLENIREELVLEGLKIGKKKNEIDTKNIINSILLKRNDIAWMGISLDGTNAIVEIVEAKEKPDLINETDYSDIVSDKDGIITKINVKSGTAIVKEGDIVKKGDVLVVGKMDGKYTGETSVVAEASIEARVWYSKKEKQSFFQEVESLTSREEKKYSIKINNFEIFLYKTLSKYEKYDTIINSKKLSLFSFYLPIEIITKTNREKVIQSVTYNENELKNLIIKKLEEELNEETKQVNVINKYVNYKSLEDGLELELVYETYENIGIKDTK